MTPSDDRRQQDAEKHLEVMTRLENLNTKFDEVIKPAVTQTWESKNKIIELENSLKYMWRAVSVVVVFIVGLCGRLAYKLFHGI